MTDQATATPVSHLIVQLLEWLEPGPRPYDEVMEAWRSSCPRLTVWEDAIDAGYVVRTPAQVVELTPLGRAFVRQAAG